MPIEQTNESGLFVCLKNPEYPTWCEPRHDWQGAHVPIYFRQASNAASHKTNIMSLSLRHGGRRFMASLTVQV